MIRKIALFAFFALGVSSFVACGDSAYYEKGDEETGNSLNVLDGNRALLIFAHGSFDDFGSDVLVKIAKLAMDVI